MEQRVSLATPQDTARGLFINRTLEVVRDSGSEVALARCREVLGEQRLMDFGSYPVTLLVRLMSTAVRELSGSHGGMEPVLRMMGHKAAAGIMTSGVGNVMRSLGLNDTEQLRSSFQAIYKVTTNYGERSVVWSGPRSGRLTMRRSFLPMPYHEGALRNVLGRLGAQDVRIVARELGPLDSEYDFSWE